MRHYFSDFISYLLFEILRPPFAVSFWELSAKPADSSCGIIVSYNCDLQITLFLRVEFTSKTISAFVASTFLY